MVNLKLKILFDFNQVLKRSLPDKNFVSILGLQKNKIARDKIITLANLNVNSALINWAINNQDRFNIYIWSASDNEQLQLFKEVFKPLFSVIVSTQETGLYKSEVISYKKVEIMLNAQASECLLVDDQIENIQAALAAGWHAIHFTSTADCLHQLDTILE